MSPKIKNKLKVFATAALLILSCSVSTAFATPSAKPFTDTGSDHWGYKDIIKMNIRGVVTGYTDGTFQPNKPVTQLEAVLMAVHNMCPNNDFSSIDDTQPLPVTLPEWAEKNNKKEILYAVQKGLIVTSENNFNASDNASRAWVAQLMVRMINKNGETAQYQGQTVPVADASSVPDWAAPYINIALKYKVASGYPDNTFKPNQAVTRAEMVSLLSRGEQFLSLGGKVLRGQVVNITSQNLTLSVNNTIKNVNISSNTWIFDNKGKLAEWSAISSNAPVTVVLDGLSIKYLEALPAEAVVSTIKGTVLQLLPDSKLIAVRDETQKIHTLTLASYASISAQNGSINSLDQIETGYQVELSLNSANEIVSIVVVTSGPNAINTGYIFNIDTDQKLIIIKNAIGNYNTYQYNDDLAVNIPDQRFPSITDLRAGDEVKIKATDDLITEIELVQPSQQLTLKGTVVIISTDKKIITVEKDDNTLQAFGISDQVKISIDGLSTPQLSDVLVNDAVNLTIEKGIVTEIKVENRNYEDTIKGTVVAVDTSSKIITLKLENDSLKAYEVNNSAVFDIDGDSNSSLSDVEKDMKVKIKLVNNKVVYLTNKNTVEGTVVSLDDSSDIITINTADTNQQISYELSGDVDVNIEDASGEDVGDINRQDYVELVIIDDIVTDINVRKTITYNILKIDSSNDSFKVKDGDGNTRYLYLTDSVDLVVPNIEYPDIKDFKSGDVITATFLGDTLIKVEAAKTYTGQVASVNSSSGNISIKEFDGTNSVFTYNSNSKVIDNDNYTYGLNFLANGDRVEIAENADGSLTISKMDKLSGQFQSLNSTHDKIDASTSQGAWSNYNLSPNVYIHSGSTVLSITSLKVNDSIDLYVIGDTIYEIEKK